MSLCVDIQKQLGDFTLSVQHSFPDGATAVIGASGSGKSMLLRCIAGIEVPDSGRITCGQDVWYDAQKKTFLPPQKRRAGYLFQQYALFENKTVMGNIMIGMRGTKEEKRRQCAGWLERFQLTEIASQHPSELSGGQMQRTALARMLAAKPRVLLLDEPFSALDTHLREQMHRQMAEVLEQHDGTALLVTHDFTEAMQLCCSAVVVSDGRIVEQGSCRAIWEHPQTRAGAELTGMRNFLPVPESMCGTVTDCSCVGIRPERLRPAREEDSFRISGTVKRILPDISSSHVELIAGKRPLIWKTKNTDVLPEKGQEITLSARQEDLHFFKK